MKNLTFNVFSVPALLALWILNAAHSTAFAQGTAFTYQGQLQNNGSLASGTYDLQFTLYTNATGGNSVTGPVTNSAVTITNGFFTVTMDFGPGPWNGQTTWLQIGVESNDITTFTPLSPRQQLTPVPYAIFAEGGNAAGLTGTLPMDSLGGIYGGAVNLTNAGNSFTGTFGGYGAGLSNVNATLLNGLAPSNFWQTSGNSGTTAGPNFVGTTDNQALELHVNGVRALRLEPTATNGAVNVIGGSPNNFVGAGVVGATIGGGGAINYSGASFTNSVTVDFGTVGGGYANNANAYASVIAGGYQNVNNGFVGFLGAGDGNTIVGSGAGDGAVLVGGYSNTNGGEAAVLVGGTANFIGGFANNSFIGGGANNSIVGSYVLPVFGVISGGYNNSIQTNIAYAFIGGGENNVIQTGSSGSFIGGGKGNNLYVNASYATISGGNGNSANYSSTVGGGALNNASGLGAAVAGGGIWVSNSFLYNVGNRANGTSAFIGSGVLNSANGNDSVVGGGYQNTAGNAQFNSGNSPVVAGGYQNTAGADFSVVSGGADNAATNDYTTVGGGYQNTAGGVFGYSTVGGGYQNNATGTYSTVSGGANNTANGSYTAVGGGYVNAANGTGATVPGGIGNVASGAGSFAAGQDAQAVNNGAFVWSDGTATTSSAANNQFAARASGGVIFYSSSANNVGVQLPAGSGSWSSLSDRDAKNNIMPVDSQLVLARVASLPLATWSYKTEHGVRHIGPMAQDFHAAFNVGEDDRHIADVDEGGVALTAIKGLNQKLEEQIKESKDKDAEIADLKVRLDALEQIVLRQKSN
jgi:hypothetical protein